jgi:hypothetical protein
MLILSSHEITDPAVGYNDSRYRMPDEEISVTGHAYDARGGGRSSTSRIDVPRRNLTPGSEAVAS